MRTIAASTLLSALMLIAPEASAEPLFAEVRLNSIDAGKVLQFDKRGEDLAASAQDLREIGLRLDPGPASEERQEPILLSTIPGVRYRLDPRTQSVELEVDPGRMTAHRLARDGSPALLPDRTASGAVLNYGVYGIVGDGRPAQASLIADARVFGPLGVLSQGFTLRHAPGDLNDGLRRLDTTFVRDDYRNARRLIVGDFISAGLAWTQPVRAAGVSLSTDFTLRPDLVTQPLPQLRGVAAVPSTVDLYLDGVRRLASQTPAGPFSIDMAPMVNGRGEVSMVVTDAFGRLTAQTFDFYAANDLLRAGTQSFALEAGALREGYAGDDDSYAGGFTALTARRGLSDVATAELHAVATGGFQSLGAGVVANLGDEAILAAAYDVSTGPGGEGGQYYLSVKRETGVYSAFAMMRRSTRGYEILGRRRQDVRARSESRVGASVRAGRWGTITAAYNDMLFDRTSLRVASLNWSGAVGPVSLYANAVTSLGEVSRTTVSLGFATPFGAGGRSLDARAATAGGDVRLGAQVAQPPPDPYGWGWRMSTDADSGNRRMTQIEAEARRTTSLGEFGVGANRYGGDTALRAYGSGALIWMGGRPWAAAQVGESFALIETGEPNVAVTLENRAIGRTGPDGRLLATQMSSEASSRIAVVAESVALNDEIVTPMLQVRPARGSGVVVRLPVRRIDGAMVAIVGPDGAPVSAGLPVRLNGREEGVVGFDGMVFLTHLKARNSLEIRDQSGVCRLEVPYVPVSGALPQIGPLVCDLAPPGDRLDGAVRHADAGPGEPDLLRADGNLDLRGLQSPDDLPQRLERLRRDKMHLHALGLRGLQL